MLFTNIFLNISLVKSFVLLFLTIYLRLYDTSSFIEIYCLNDGGTLHNIDW